MSEYSGYLIITLLIIDIIILAACAFPKLLGDRMGYRWRRTLWLILAVRLLIPVQSILAALNLSAPVFEVRRPDVILESAANMEKVSAGAEKILSGQQDKTELAAQTEETGVTPGQTGTQTEIQTETSAAASGNQPEDASSRPGFLVQLVSDLRDFGWELSLCLVWLITAAALLGIRSLQYQSLRKKVRENSSPCRDLYVKKTVKEICSALSLKRTLRVRICDIVQTPMLFGYFRPAILIPRMSCPKEELEMILRHEIRHYKNNDLWYKLLMAVVCDLYWFNPVLRLMKSAAYRDLECVCDDGLIKEFGLRQRKVYASVILRSAARNQKDTVFHANFAKERSSAEVRIRNIFSGKGKWGWGVLAVLVLLIMTGTCLWGFAGRADKGTGNPDSGLASGNGADDQTGDALPVFLVERLEQAQVPKEFELSSQYITNRVVAFNRFYIDDQSVLWGYGENDRGQLGTGTVDELGSGYSEPVRIASDVVTVDASKNGYFCVYVTADGGLYAMGENLYGMFGDGLGEEVRGVDYPVITEPVRVMDDVAYARAGRECVTVLKTDGSVWWWGAYSDAYYLMVNEADYQYSYSVDENVPDEGNSGRMLYTSPHKMLDHCVYAVTGDYVGAAITETGELYTWGRNLIGEAGTALSSDAFRREPVKVLDHVRMVWPQQIKSGSLEEDIPERFSYDLEYDYNLFALTEGGTYMASGQGLGDQVRMLALGGDYSVPEECRYSDTFVPVKLKEYSEEETKELVNGLAPGISMDEVLQLLDREGIRYRAVYEGQEISELETADENEIRVYMIGCTLCFDSGQKLSYISWS